MIDLTLGLDFRLPSSSASRTEGIRNPRTWFDILMCRPAVGIIRKWWKIIYPSKRPYERKMMRKFVGINFFGVPDFQMFHFQKESILQAKKSTISRRCISEVVLLTAILCRVGLKFWNVEGLFQSSFVKMLPTLFSYVSSSSVVSTHSDKSLTSVNGP